MVNVDVVIGDISHKWIETLDVTSRKNAAAETRKVVDSFNENLRIGEKIRVFYCVVPMKPSTPKKKIVIPPEVPFPTAAKLAKDENREKLLTKGGE